MAGIFSKLKNALTKTSSKIGEGIEHIFIKKRLDEDSLSELEDILISADVGVTSAGKIVKQLHARKFQTEITTDEIKQELASIISDQLSKKNHILDLTSTNNLQIILVCGVNGNGKTTSIGKLASHYKSLGKKVAVAACDTFRAAAIDQLALWTNRAGVELFQGSKQADPASVAHMAVSESIKTGVDILFIDTAGRLHNHKNLMDELAKILRVITKIIPEAPHHTLLVIDATTGQNAFTQAEQFKNIANISGLIITKLDGTAKAGAIIGVVEKYDLPIHFIGIGEGIDDLKEFEAKKFAKALVGL